MEVYEELFVSYNVSKESGIQNLPTSSVILQKVFFLTGFETYFTYLSAYFALFGGSTFKTYLAGIRGRVI